MLPRAICSRRYDALYLSQLSDHSSSGFNESWIMDKSPIEASWLGITRSAFEPAGLLKSFNLPCGCKKHDRITAESQ